MAIVLAVILGLYVLVAPALAVGGWQSTPAAADNNGDGAVCLSLDRMARGQPAFTDDQNAGTCRTGTSKFRV